MKRPEAHYFGVRVRRETYYPDCSCGGWLHPPFSIHSATGYRAARWAWRKHEKEESGERND